MSVHAEVKRVLAEHPDGDPLVLAGSVVARCSKADLTPLVADEIRSAQRAVARTQENAAFRETFAVKVGDVPAAAVESLRPLFATPFHLGDGSAVPWLEATADQHRERMAYLGKIRDGIDQTIDRHREAVSLIESAGVRCLADLTEIKAPAAA